MLSNTVDVVSLFPRFTVTKYVRDLSHDYLELGSQFLSLDLLFTSAL